MKKTIMMALSAALVLGLSACADKGETSVKKNTSGQNTDLKLDEAELDAKQPPVVVAEEDLGLRKTNLYSEKSVLPTKAVFKRPEPGAAKTFQRSYFNAPPLIPHSIDGLVPITKNNNACLGCHLPSVAKSVGATPIPPTHFVDFRTGKKLNHVADQRWNCVQCHVPQANVKPLVKNNFKPDYPTEEAKHKSNLIDVLNEGVK